MSLAWIAHCFLEMLSSLRHFRNSSMLKVKDRGPYPLGRQNAVVILLKGVTSNHCLHPLLCSNLRGCLLHGIWQHPYMTCPPINLHKNKIMGIRGHKMLCKLQGLGGRKGTGRQGRPPAAHGRVAGASHGLEAGQAESHSGGGVPQPPQGVFWADALGRHTHTRQEYRVTPQTPPPFTPHPRRRCLDAAKQDEPPSQ